RGRIAAATAGTRSSSGHQGGSPSSSSSLTRSAPPAASNPAVSATSPGDKPSEGLTIAPTSTSSGASNAGPGKRPAGHSASTRRQRENAVLSAHSPARNEETSSVTSPPQFASGNSSTDRLPSCETTRPRARSGPSARPTDSIRASACAASGGSSS